MNTLQYIGLQSFFLIVNLALTIFIIRKFGTSLIKNIASGVNEVFGKTTVKRAMSIVGKQGGDTKAVNAITNKIAKGFINQNYGLIKIAAEKIGGVNFDELVDDYGAENILVAVQKIAPSLGIDLNSMIANFGGGQKLNTSEPIVYPREE